MMDQLTQEQFEGEFIKVMKAKAGFENFDDGTAVADYALEVAHTYYSYYMDGDSVDDCVQGDMDYWGEE